MICYYPNIRNGMREMIPYNLSHPQLGIALVHNNINIKIGCSDIKVVSSLTNLALRLDINLKMTPTSHLMNSCTYQLKLVNCIRASIIVQVRVCKDYKTPLQDVQGRPGLVVTHFILLHFFVHHFMRHLLLILPVTTITPWVVSCI